MVLALPGTPGELERYNLSTPDGGAQTATLDTTFGTSGVATLPTGYSIGTGGGAGSVAVEPQLGGDVIVQGSGNGGVAPIAFTASGAIDTSYGPAGNGIGSAMPISGGSSIENVSGQTGYGDLLIAGSLNNDFAVARYLASTTVTNMAMAGSALTDSVAKAVMARPSIAAKLLAEPTSRATVWRRWEHGPAAFPASISSSATMATGRDWTCYPKSKGEQPFVWRIYLACVATRARRGECCGANVPGGSGLDQRRRDPR